MAEDPLGPSSDRTPEKILAELGELIAAVHSIDELCEYFLRMAKMQLATTIAESRAIIFSKDHDMKH